MFSKFIRILTFVMAMGGFIGISLVIRQVNAQDPVTNSAPPFPPPEKPYEHTVAGTGILEALSENVSIGVPVQGLVTDVLVKVNDVVAKDQPLFKIDDRELQAQLVKFRASVEVARSRVMVQQSALDKADDLLKRLQSVPDRRAVSVDELRSREMDVAMAKAQLHASNVEVTASEADVKQAEILVERLTVKAPREGTILQVNIRAGEYAAFAPKAPAVVLGDLEKLQVRVDIDEQNATRIRPGQAATAYIKGDTKHPIQLQFVRIEPYVIPKVSLTGSSTERVDTRVLQVIFSLQRPKDSPIYVGQQVDIYIDESDAKPAS